MSKAIIVVDVQNGFITPESAHVPGRIKSLLDQVSFEHRIFTRFLNCPGSPYEKLLSWTRLRESPEIDIVPTLADYPTVIVDKNIYSSVGPELNRIAAEHELTEFYVCGIDTEICVLKTCVDLFESGHRPLLLADCCMSHYGPTLHEAGLAILPRFIGGRQMIEDSAKHFGLPRL